MLIWILGKNGMLAKALNKLLTRSGTAFIASSKEEADITSLFSLKKFADNKNITHIINAAAYTDVARAEKEEQKAFAVNADGVKNLAAVAEEKKAKLVHISTDYVFDGREQKPYSEEDMPNPLNIYGKSKLEGEKQLQQLREFLIVRTSWLFGEDGKNFPFNILRKMQTEKEMKVVSDQFGRPTFAEDLAAAVLSLLPFAGIFHFAGDKIVSWYQFALDIFLEAKRQDLKLRTENIRPVFSSELQSSVKRPLFSVLDTQKIQRHIQKAALPYLTAVEKAVQSFRKNFLLLNSKEKVAYAQN